MAVASESGSVGTRPGPARRRGAGGVPMDLLRRFLMLREGSIIVVTVITIIYFAATTSNYFTYSNFKSLLPYFCFLAIMAAGQVFVMTLGEIDLSIGAAYLFTPFVLWKLNDAGVPLVLSMILSLGIVGVVGIVNGFFVAYVGIASFVVTLAMLFFLDGLTLILSHSEQINMPGTSTIGTTTFATIFGEGTYSELIWAVGIAVVLQAVLSYTRVGHLHGRGRREPARRGRGGDQHAAGAGPELRALRRHRRVRRDPRGRADDDDHPRPLGVEPVPAVCRRRGDHRRHADDRRRRHGDRGPDRRAVHRRPPGRPDDQERSVDVPVPVARDRGPASRW